jgi:hypothetical protein
MEPMQYGTLLLLWVKAALTVSLVSEEMVMIVLFSGWYSTWPAAHRAERVVLSVLQLWEAATASSVDGSKQYVWHGM